MSDDQPHQPADASSSSQGDASLLPIGAQEPLENPGLPAHQQRPTDVDPALERRAELQVSAMFVLAAVLALAFCVAYFTVDLDSRYLGLGASNLALGLTLGLSLLLIGIGAIQWAKKLMSDHEMIEYRHSAAGTQADREEAVAAFQAGSEESGFGRRKLIRNSLLGSMAMLGLPAVVVFGDLGPLPGIQLEQTVWRRGMRVVVDVAGTPIRPSELQIGELVNAEPEVFFEHPDANGTLIPSEFEGAHLQVERTKAAVILVRIPPEEIKPLKSRENWGVEGILCYSKICTHVGCPISLYEQQTHNVLCPCHQSTFDLADNGRVLFGPASRSLPQLPLGVDDEGYLIAMSGFLEPVGPSFWERG